MAMLVYLTSKAYPADTADKIYAREMARSFNRILKKDFLFIVANDFSQELENINSLNLHFRMKRFRAIFYFLWLPYFIFSAREKDLVFFSNDPYLLLILIFWRIFLRFQYKICSDWHMAFNDWRDVFITKNSDYVITTSEKLKKIILNISKINENKILVAYGGIDLEKYKIVDKKKAREFLNLPMNKKLIAYVGFFKTMGMEKGLKTMIKSLPILDQDSVMMFVGGTDKEIDEYKNFAKTLDVSDRCIFIGRKIFDDVVLYQQAADMLVIPYPDQPHFRDYGFPMKVYEYMASNRPIIYSKLQLSEEVVGEYSFAFKPDDPIDLARVIKYVFINYKEAEGLARQTFTKVLNYTWENKIGIILQHVYGTKDSRIIK